MLHECATSVLLPVYNAGNCLAPALDSVLLQTDADFELIAVDDGSTDGTPALLRRYGELDSRVRIVRCQRHAGIVPALNGGLRVARGEFIARMDADDVSHPDRLRQQREFLQTHPDVGLVGCRVEFGGDPEVRTGYWRHVEWMNSLLDHDAITLNRFIESPFAHPSVMFRRSIAETLGGYRDGPFPEDYEMWLRWLDAGVRVSKLSTPLLLWNDSPHRLSRTDQRYSFRAFYECKAGYLGRWLREHNSHHPEVIIWGAGRETRKRAEFLAQHGVRFLAYVDIDPRKLGKTIHGRPVIPEAHLPAPDDCFVVSYVASRGAREDIRRRLIARDFVEGIHFVMAA